METNIKDKIDYKFIDANIEDKGMLIKYKLSTIYEYADNLSEEENNRIKDYVNEEVPRLLNKYKIVVYNNEKIGSLLVDDYLDGKMLDEIYLEDKFRGMGIGSSLIEDILNKHDVVYLWVYKDNKRAIKLYKRYGFSVEEETESRYFMKWKRRR